MATKYTETFTLPTRGLLYENIPDEVTIRAITTSEEKMMIGSKDALDNIISACIVEPKEFDIDELVIPDKYFLLMKLRIITYGSNYHARIRCPNPECREPYTYKINLDDLTINYLDDDFVEPIEITLPASGDKIGLKLLRNKDNKKVEKRAKQMKRKFPDMKGDISYILRLCEYIVTLNGEEFPAHKKQKYVQELIGMDSAYIKDKIESIKVGYDLDIYEECPYCGEAVEFVLPMTEEFFRPKFDN